MQKNETGDIKCLDEKGNIKWFPEIIVNNRRLMKERGFTVFESPIKAEAKTFELLVTDNTKEIETEVAEASHAKRGRKSNK